MKEKIKDAKSTYLNVLGLLAMAFQVFIQKDKGKVPYLLYIRYFTCSVAWRCGSQPAFPFVHSFLKGSGWRAR